MSGRPWWESLLGYVRSNGAKIPLSGGLNFKSPLSATFDPVDAEIDVAIDEDLLGDLIAAADLEVADDSITAAMLTDGAVAMSSEDGGTLTIADGVLTVGRAGRYLVDTEGAAAVDAVTSIAGGTEGQVVVLSPVSGARVPIFVHIEGTLELHGRKSVVQASPDDRLVLQKRGSKWVAIAPPSYGLGARTVGDGSTVALADMARVLGLVANSASAVALGIPEISAASFPVDGEVLIHNLGAGVVTLTCAAGDTLNGVDAGSVTIAQFKSCRLRLISGSAWVAEVEEVASTPTISAVLAEGSDASGATIRNIGAASGGATHLTDANVYMLNRLEAGAGWVVNTNALSHDKGLGLYRITWFVEVRDTSGDVWGFEWLSHTHLKSTGPDVAVLRLNRAITGAADLEGTPPNISMTAEIAFGGTRLVVTNSSGEILDMRVSAIQLYTISPEVT